MTGSIIEGLPTSAPHISPSPYPPQNSVLFFFVFGLKGKSIFTFEWAAET